MNSNSDMRRAYGLFAIEAPPYQPETKAERERRVREQSDPRRGTRCWNCNVDWPEHSETCAGRQR